MYHERYIGMYSLYYQAEVERSKCWVVTATLRYHEHVAFDRAVDVAESVFEFFVSPDLEEEFLYVMATLEKAGIISHIKKLPNRMIDSF